MMSDKVVNERVKIRDFRDKILVSMIRDIYLLNHADMLSQAEVRDIEDMAEIGRSMKICPYYASRSAIQVSEVRVLLVYKKHIVY